MGDKRGLGSPKESPAYMPPARRNPGIPISDVALRYHGRRNSRSAALLTERIEMIVI